MRLFSRRMKIYSFKKNIKYFSKRDTSLLRDNILEVLKALKDFLGELITWRCFHWAEDIFVEKPNIILWQSVISYLEFSELIKKNPQRKLCRNYYCGIKPRRTAKIGGRIISIVRNLTIFYKWSISVNK